MLLERASAYAWEAGRRREPGEGAGSGTRV